MSIPNDYPEAKAWYQQYEKVLHGTITDYPSEGVEVIRLFAERIEELEERDRLLTELEASGVDNWSGWDDALERLTDGDNQ